MMIGLMQISINKLQQIAMISIGKMREAVNKNEKTDAQQQAFRER